MKVTIFFLTALFANCSASIFGGSGSNGGHGGGLSISGGYSYGIGQDEGGVAEGETIKVIHEEAKGGSSFGGHAALGGGVNSDEVKTIKVVHEHGPAASGGNSYSSYDTSGLNEFSSGGFESYGSKGISVGGQVNSAGSGEVKVIRVIHEHSGSAGHGGFASGGGDIKTIKVIHEHASGTGGYSGFSAAGFGGHSSGGYSSGGHYSGGYPSGGHSSGGYPSGGYSSGGLSSGGYASLGHSSAGYSKGGYSSGGHSSGFPSSGGYSSGGHGGSVKTIKVIHENAASPGNTKAGFSGFGGSSHGAGLSSAGFSDPFETLKSLKVIGALSHKGGAKGYGAPTAQYLPTATSSSWKKKK